ncbi:MAG TPA: hypothetical protein VFW03_26725 [Gemmatimonadaceae bacterium]|nr:hypothetical protein [Gemmatimonadaceae bacterium]
MERKHLLAAELFAYSFANYADHLGVNDRFDKFMPEEVALLESAEREAWSDDRVARALKCDVADVPGWRDRFRRAVAIVDAPTPAEAFRRGVRDSIAQALDEGLSSTAAIESLVTQVCYRAADLAVLLQRAGMTLDDYSEELRRDPESPLGPT